MEALLEFISFSDGLTFDSIISLFVLMMVINAVATTIGNMMKGVSM